MKTPLNISFPLIHKRSHFPTIALIFTIIGTIPTLMVMWVALCSEFTRVEGSNGTTTYNIYVCLRATFAVTTIVCLVPYNNRRTSIPLIPASILGFGSALMRLIIVLNSYLDKKELADSMSMHPSYTQNFIDIAESSLLFILSVFFLMYLFGIFKTTFPIIFASVIAVVFMIYSIISYTTTYETTAYTVICKSYAIPLALGTFFFSLASKSRKQLENKERYQPRRMR